MKIFSTFFSGQTARFIGGLFAMLFLATGAAAQPAGYHQPGRFLFVFETSPTVKKSLPAVEKSLEAIFTNSLTGELVGGDEVGVWMVDDQLHTGLVPLTTWEPKVATVFPAQLKTFLGKQWFRHDGNLALLEPSLNRVVENSERLTVIIFCDGQTGIAGTPFDGDIHGIFKAYVARQKKLRQPFIVVLRAQLGRFITYAVTLSPNPLNLPEFPPLPVEPAPVVVTNPPVVVKPPPVVVPSLVMVGTNLSTGHPPTAPPLPEKSTAEPPAIPVNVPVDTPVEHVATTNKTSNNNLAVKTNLPVAVAEVHATTNLLTNPPVLTAPAVMAIAPETPPDADNGTKILLAIGGAAILAAVALVIILVARSRRQRGSLITSSMNLPRTPPRQK